MKKLMALVLSFAMVFSTVPAFAATAAPATSIDYYYVGGIPASVEYDGNAKVISNLIVMPRVTSGDMEVLVEGRDMTVTYENNINPGTAKLTIEGKGDYTGKIEKTFQIKKTFTDAEVDAIAAAMGGIKEQTTGTPFVCPEVKWNDITLAKDVDYTLTADTSKAGDKTAVIKFIGCYSGKDITKAFKVADPKKSIADANVYFTTNKAYAFTGFDVKPQVSVAYSTYMLAEGTDYTVSYDKNISASSEAKVIVTGIGAFEGTAEKTFTIGQADLKDAVVTLEKDAYTVTGNQVKPVVTSVKLGDYVVPATDYTVTYGENKAIGEGTVTLTASTADTASKNVKGSVTVKFTIAAKTAEDFQITLDKSEFTQDGTAHKPAVTVKDGDKVLAEGTDYTVEYADNVAAGTGKVIVTGKGAYSGSKTAEFRIKGEDSELITGYTIYTKYYGNKDFNLNAKISTGEAGVTFKYTALNPEVATVDVNGNVSIKHTGIAKFKVETVGTVASDPASKTVTVKVKPKKPAVSSLSSTKKGSVKVNVLKSAGSTKYEIRYGRMGNYKYKTIRHIDSVYTKTYTTVSKLTSGKTYYIKVRAITVAENGTELKGNWSSTKKIKVK